VEDNMLHRITSLRIVAAAVVALAAAAPVRAQSNAPAERFTANAVNISNVGRTGATPVEIVVDRWSSDAERERLVGTLLDKGPEELLKALQKAPKVGYIRTPDSIGYDLHFAWQAPDAEKGRRIVIATDRPIGFWEAVNRPRTVDYPFTVIDMRIGQDGKGEGKLSIATRITGNKETKTIEIENFATQPVMLNNIRSEPKK
jgi:hypothetical protein